jgi:predicted alpha/beta superfamily hydrolase
MMKVLYCILFTVISVDIYSQVSVVSGRVIRHENFKSTFINPRNVDVWLPVDYSPKKKYPVLYMHDGQMLFDSTTTWNKQEWQVDEVISKLIKENKIKPVIGVGVWNTQLRHSEYFPQKPFESLPQAYRDSLISYAKRNATTGLFQDKVQSDNYLKFLTTELKPFIDKTYATKKDQKNTFIAGSSMGGLISLYAICEYPKIFGGAACLSTHWPGIFTVDNNPIPEAFIQYMKTNLPNPNNHKIYFDFGTATLDALYEPLQSKADEVMRAKGYTLKNWTTIKYDGAEHSERAWANRLDVPFTFLLAK